MSSAGATSGEAEEPAIVVEMLIRRPAGEVFEAFIDPEITSKFWFSEGSDRLDRAGTVTWNWAVYGVSAEIEVVEIIADEKIVFDWPGNSGKTRVAWTFTARPDGSTFVSIRIPASKAMRPPC